MNKITKHLVAIFVGLVLMAGSVVAKPNAAPAPQAPAPEEATEAHHGMCPMSAVMEFSANPVCYLPGMGAFVVVDSIDCAVDVLVREGDTYTRVGRFTTDVYTGRHDLKNIVRPVSVNVFNGYVIVLATSQKDSSFIAALPLANCKDENTVLEPVQLIGFNNTAYAFKLDCINGEIVVVGKNPVGYDLNTVDIKDGVENMAIAAKFHYHVPKQAERIQESDPNGGGLALVAICVVFIALICICFIMLGYGAIIQKVTEKNENKDKKSEPKVASVSACSKAVDGEVYAAIAAAIYAYEQDLHDEEDTVITIQKVERAWTPWNAKFYNMNQYFSNKK